MYGLNTALYRVGRPAIAILFSLLVLPSAHAQEPTATPEPIEVISLDEQQRVFFDGVQAFRKGAYGRAAELFQSLAVDYQHPDLIFNIARSHEAMGDELGAKAWYEAYLRGSPHDESAIRQKIKALSTQGFAGDAAETVGVPALALTAPVGSLGKHRTAMGWLAGGLGLMALSTSVIFGAQAIGAQGSAESSADRDVIARFNAEASDAAFRSDLMLGGAVIGLGTAAVLWWLMPQESVLAPKGNQGSNALESAQRWGEY